MKHTFFVAVVLLCVACSSSSSLNAQTSRDTGSSVTAYEFQSPAGEPLTGESGAVMESVVTVEKVDKENRILTVKNDAGTTTSFKVGPDVKRFSEIKKGDSIVAQIVQAIAYEVRPPTREEKMKPVAEVAIGGRNEEQLPPGAGVANAVRKLVTIQAIDKKANTVTIKAPAGETTVLPVQHPENLERVKVGDTVLVTYVEAVAIGVEPRK